MDPVLVTELEKAISDKLSGKTSWTKEEVSKLAPKYKGSVKKFCPVIAMEIEKEHLAMKAHMQKRVKTVDLKQSSRTYETMESSIINGGVNRCNMEDAARTIFYALKPVYDGNASKYIDGTKLWMCEMVSILKLTNIGHQECNCCLRWKDLVPISFTSEFGEYFLSEKFSYELLTYVYELMNKEESITEVKQQLEKIMKACEPVIESNRTSEAHDESGKDTQQNSSSSIVQKSISKLNKNKNKTTKPKAKCNHNIEVIETSGKEVGKLIIQHALDRQQVNIVNGAYLSLPVRLHFECEDKAGTAMFLSKLSREVIKKLEKEMALCEKCSNTFVRSANAEIWLHSGHLRSQQYKPRKKTKIRNLLGKCESEEEIWDLGTRRNYDGEVYCVDDLEY